MDRSKITCKPYSDLVYQAFSQFNENSINNQDSHSQIENDKSPRAEYPKESDSVGTKTNKISVIPNFMSQTLVDDEIAKGISSLN